MQVTQKTIIGIDPGTQIMGYSVIKIDSKNNIEVVTLGVIHLKKYLNTFDKLRKIYDRTSQLIQTYKPNEMAIEAPFYSVNVQSMLKLGRAQGVVIAAAAMHHINVCEYSPRKIKQSVTGNGNASKEQVSAMLSHQLKTSFDSQEYLDATDALGVAVCHFYQTKNSILSNSKAKNWADFVKQNPDKVK